MLSRARNKNRSEAAENNKGSESAPTEGGDEQEHSLREQLNVGGVGHLYEGESDYEEDEDSFGDDEDDDDWKPSGCRQMRVLKRPSRGRRKTDSLRQTRSRSRITVRGGDENERKVNLVRPCNSDEEDEEEEEDLEDIDDDEEKEVEEEFTSATSSTLTGGTNATSIAATLTTHKPDVNSKAAVRIRVCFDCGQKHPPGDCPLSHPVAVVRDLYWEADSLLSQSESTLPKILKLETVEKIHGPSVFTLEKIRSYTQFGPLVGKNIAEAEISEDANLKNIWEVFGETKLYLDTADPSSSNWLRYLRPAPSREERNVTSITRDNYNLYFITIRDVEAGAELLYWSDDPTITWSKKKLEKTSCGGCNQRFEHPLYYRMHCMIFHDPNYSLTIRKYHCKVCGVAVLGKENIMKHAMEKHEGRGAYQCQYCKKFFLRLNYLEMHRTYGCRLNPQRSRPLCDLCGKKFCQPQKLKVHIRRMHSDMSEVLKEFQCKTCLKLLGSRAALQRHLKEVHNKDQNIAATCDRCGKTFQNKSNLKIHMLTHSGVKPFRCNETGCTAAFTTKQCLQFHYKKVHGYGMHNMPSIERCVAYTFESYSGGLVSHYEKKEHKNRMKQLCSEDEAAMMKNHNHEAVDDDEDNVDLHKSFQLTPEKLVEAALKTMDSSSLSSLSENVACIKQEGSELHPMDSASENSMVEDLPNPAPPELHDPRAMDVEPAGAAQHSDGLLQSCSPRAASPVVSKCPSMETFSRQASAIQRQAGLLAFGLPATAATRSVMMDGRECKSVVGGRMRLLDPLQQLEQTLELSRRSDLASPNAYSNLALCLSRQRVELMGSGLTDMDSKPCNRSDSSSNSIANSLEVDAPPPGHVLDMTGQAEENRLVLSHRMALNCSVDQEMEMHHAAASEQNLDMDPHQSELDISRHSEQGLVINCHSEQGLELHHASEGSGLDMMHHHHHHPHHHGLELNSSPLSSEHGLVRHSEHDLRRHMDHNLNLVHHGEQGNAELVHHALRRNLHIDLNQHNERGALRPPRPDHNLAIVVGRSLELDPSNEHRMDMSPRPPQLTNSLRREHLLELAAHEASAELAHSLSRSGHLDAGRLHADLRSPLSLPEHHGYNLLQQQQQQHRPDLSSPIERHPADQTIDMSCHASSLNSPTPSRCSDLNSPLPHQEPNIDLVRQTETPVELSRPPSHSIDLSTGRPTPLPAAEGNRPPSHGGGGGRQMPLELLPLETTRMVSPGGYQPYSPPVYQAAPPAHMPSPSSSLHANYHTYSGYY